MSSPFMLGYPDPGGNANAFDIAGITAAIDRAAASLSPEERGSLTVQLDDKGIGAGLVVRIPYLDRATVLAQVTKPRAGTWGYRVAGRISFLAGIPTPLREVRVAPELRGLYRLFRSAGNGKLLAAVKAVKAARGLEVRLRG